ncbi:MAG: aminopeptidase [bacterium]|nr:aminopeptidase [bacterium]
MLRRRAPRLAFLIGVLVVVAGCGQPLYVARLGWEEARILWRREPIPDLLARSDLDPALRERFELVLAARAFADERLGFRVGQSYGTFAEVDDRGVVHVLQAARRDRLESHTWWYPVAGRVPYRGFFDVADAEAAGDRLAARGLDVDVRPAIAFSTLGWFADPLLSSTAEASPEGVVETVLHELFHATLYVPGEPAFNESAATFAGHRGAVAFFCDGPGADPARCARAREAWRATQARGVVLGRLAAKLRRLYAADPPEAERERVRARLALRAGRALEAQRAGRATELVPPNNARLLGALLYVTDLDAFEALAPGESDPGPALRALVAAANGKGDPFAQVRALSPDDLPG